MRNYAFNKNTKVILLIDQSLDISNNKVLLVYEGQECQKIVAVRCRWLVTESKYEGMQLFNARNTNGYTDSIGLIALWYQASTSMKDSVTGLENTIVNSLASTKQSSWRRNGGH